MKTFTLTIFTILVFISISVAQTFSDKIVLNKNQKILATTTSSATTSMQIMGQNIETVTEGTNINTIEVKDVTPNGYKLTTTVNKIKLKSKGGPQEINFDSDKKEDMNSEIGQSIKDELKPQDEEINFSGKNANEKNAAGNEEDFQKVMQSLNGAGTNSAAGNFILIPSGKKTGDVWVDSSSANGVKTKNTYTLQQIKGNDATIAINTTSNINKTVKGPGAEVTIVMDLKVSSQNVVDIATGLIKEKVTTAEGTGNLGAGGQEIPMTSKVTSTTTIKKL
ncbi:MAG: DUF6263 family protein [Bacteroidota bacterium]|nr:DUF6263 family protein [Bacteroidota bacterium]